MHKSKKSFIQRLKDDQKSTLDTVDLLRRLDQSTNSLKDSQTDMEYELAHGPRTIMQRFWVGVLRLGRAMRSELTYVGLCALQPLLIVVFNAIAIFLFFWLLSLL